VSNESIAVIGGGAWGTALAVHLGRRGRPVRLWIREGDLVERMRRKRDNPAFLPGVQIPAAVEPQASIAGAIEGAALLVFAVPSQFARAVHEEIAQSLTPGTPLVIASKGIEETSLALPIEVASQVLGVESRLGVVSGPSFAAELAQGRPTAVVVASSDDELAIEAQRALAGGPLRVYTNDDPVGVQVAGALKNVIAIAAGVVDSLEAGNNTLAALITRGLAELSRLGARLGGRGPTFSGLAGLGDLVLTCTGQLSRNRRVGQRLGLGERLKDVVSGSRSVAEGIVTTRSARSLALRHGVEMPIVEEVHRMLYEDGAPREAIERLMGRPLTTEEPLG